MTPPRLAILLSGAGSTLQNFLDRRAAGLFPLDIAVVIASKPDAHGLARARLAGLPHAVETPSPRATHSERVFARIREAGADLVICAGWMHLLHIPADFQMRVLNVHPSLLPAFGGQGMYGPKVHAAVHASGVKVTGCTVHFADDTYDTGPIIAQGCVEIDDEDGPAEIGAKVMALERAVYPAAIVRVAGGGWRLEGRRLSLS